LEAPPNEGYFNWLTRQTGMPRSRDTHRTYWSLLHQLSVKEFRWSIRNDDNREGDGRALRAEYFEQPRVASDEDLWLDAPASMLEVLVALSRRVAFESYSTPEKWFWKLLENLDLKHYNDYHFSNEIERDVDDTLERLIARGYSSDGRGGLFPLRDPQHDQRRVELWYQMCAYLLEGEDVHNGP
jgi:hypothetical protein